MHRALSERPQPKPGAGYFVDATGAAFCPRCQGEGKDSTPMLEIGDKLHCYACGCSCLKAKD